MALEIAKHLMPMSWRAIKHQLFDFLRCFGIRDRLRCPYCGSVGTWKPHGGWLDKEDSRKVRRWLCKWCGSYHGPEGQVQAHLGKSVWELNDPNETLDLRKKDTPKNRCAGANPWRG